MKTAKNANKVETRGRKPLDIRLPKSRSFTVQKVINYQRFNVTGATIRKRLNEMVDNGDLEVRALPNEAPGHPKYLYTLVA